MSDASAIQRPANGRGRHRSHLSGPDNPNWKGGRSIASNGYVLLRMPGHHLADVRGYVYEHRLVAEQKLGRRLVKGGDIAEWPADLRVRQFPEVP